MEDRLGQHFDWKVMCQIFPNMQIWSRSINNKLWKSLKSHNMLHVHVLSLRYFLSSLFLRLFIREIKKKRVTFLNNRDMCPLDNCVHIHISAESKASNYTPAPQSYSNTSLFQTCNITYLSNRVLKNTTW